MMSKLAKKPHDYGSAFTAIDELDKAMEGMEQILDAKIDAVSDLLVGAIERIKALENPPARRKKTQAKNAETNKKQSIDS